MAMPQPFQRSLKSIFILSLIAALGACGGGGSGGKPTPVADTTPNAFSFTAVTNTAVGSEVTSTVVTITGINAAASIGITGGTYAIGSGAFTSAAGTVITGQTVTVKVTASANNSTAVTATLTVGGVSGTFSVTTVADTTPNNFTVAPAVDVQPNSVNTSAPITVAGIDAPAPIAITGGTYAIDSGAYTAAAGTVAVGQTVTLRVTAAATPTTATNAVLTIGGVTATYAVTTVADIAAPAAQILFPPPVSMTEGNTILVRGTASDAYAVKSVKVKLNGGAATTATTTDGYANWQATITLADTTVPVTATTPNTLTVVTEDDEGNIASDAAHVSIKQASLLSSHIPDAVTPFSNMLGIALDTANNRMLVADSGLQAIVAVDLTSGARTIFSGLNTPNASNPLSSPRKILMDNANGRALVLDDELNAVIAVNLSTGARTVISDATTPDANNPLSFPLSMALDIERNRLLITDYDLLTIIAVNLSSGARTIMSGNDFPNTENAFTLASGITLDGLNKRALVTDVGTDKVIAVDLITGVRTVLSDVDASNANTSVVNSLSIDLDRNSNRAIITSGNSIVNTLGIFAVNLTTGVRSVVSNSTTPNTYNIMIKPFSVAVDDTHNVALVVERKFWAIFAVDLMTGERVVFSK